MGDRRFANPYWKVGDSADKPGAVARLSDDEVIKALAHASREHNPYLANVLATEAMNRMRRGYAMAEHAGDGILGVDVEGIIRSANPAAARLLGREREALLGMDRAGLFWFRGAEGTPAPAAACPVMDAIQQARTIEGEDAWFQGADGSLLPVAYDIAPIQTEGNVEGAVVCFRDRTARAKSDEEHARWMRLLDAFYRAHDHLGLGLVIIEGSEIAHANAAFRALCGHDRLSLPALAHLGELIAPEDRAQVVEHFTRIVQLEAPERTLDFDLLRSDGARQPVRAFVAPTEPAGAAAQRLVCVVQPR